jgi:ribosome biogenesis GTPase
VGIAESQDGLEKTFETILALASDCKFKDCTHRSEVGCAVMNALENGNLDSDSYNNYLKMERENQFFESSIAERRKKDKEFGKMVKNFKKNRKLKKY